MMGAVLLLLGCELVGEIVRAALHVPVPGPVIGMVLLAALLIVGDGRRPPSSTPATPSPLDAVAGRLIAALGLLFVPAGVGIIAEGGLLRAQWLPILGGLVGSTLVSLVVTGLVMHHLVRDRSLPLPLPTPVAEADDRP